jgi:hypothetical protein
MTNVVLFRAEILSLCANVDKAATRIYADADKSANTDWHGFFSRGEAEALKCRAVFGKRVR